MNKNKKVLIISTVGLIYDGITSVIVSYLEAMDKSNLEIYVAGTMNIELSIKERIHSCGCHVVEFPNRKKQPLGYFMFLAKFIRKKKIQVVHAHGNSATLAIEMFAAWIGGCKKRIAHSHNTKCNQTKADKLLRPLFYIFYTDALACGNEAGKWLFKGRKFIVLKNGRNIKNYRFNEEARKSIRNKYNVEDKLALGHVGGFVNQKNHQFIIEIFKELKKIYPNTILFLIGDGELRTAIECKVDDLCLSNDVVFVGNTDKVADYLSAMDAMILPSLFEGLPLVSIEWQISGLPIILSSKITKECSISDNIVFLDINEKPISWAEKLIDIAHTEDRKKMSDIAIKKIKLAGFDIQDSSNNLRKIYLS